MQRITWALITGEYPPQPGGVADYTFTLARALAAHGDAVHVFAPGDGDTVDGGVQVHRVPRMFGARGTARLIRELHALPRPRVALLQFVVQSFGARGANVLFGTSLRRLEHYPLWTMFHEFAIADERRFSAARRALAWITRRIAAQAVRASTRAFVSTPAWTPLVRRVRSDIPIDWTPVCSNVATVADAARVVTRGAELRAHGVTSLVGHFGSYRMADTRDAIARLIATVLRDRTRAFVVLGRDGDAFAQSVTSAHPSLAGRVIGPGALPPDRLAESLSALDVLVQPYGEGVTARRGSLIAGLALGTPIVTTDGPLTEALWRESGAVALVRADDDAALADAVEALLADAARRARLRESATALYRERFAIERTVTTLRRCAGASA